MVKSTHVLLRQAIRRPQSRPAVAPVKKLVGKPERKIGMSTQVGDRREAIAGGRLFRYADCIGVVEPERRGHADALFCQCSAQQGQSMGVRSFEQFLAEGAGIFRVYVDIALEQCRPEYAGTAEVTPVSGLYVVAGHGEFDDFAQDDGFGEFL